MKLYIPTTSLNFNNILSTESISPRAFYSQRGFGYSRWFTIPENEIEGAILLYESPYKIVRPISDMEDHPLWIEIETNEDYPMLKSGIRYSQRTIYLNPWHTKFYFQTDKDKTVALSLSDSSLETKLIRLYSRKIYVKEFSDTFPSLDFTPNIPVDFSGIEEDIRLNKIKGLLYGYYIGANFSSSLEDVKTLNTLREILNIFAATISSQERVPTTSQMTRLYELFGILRQNEPLYNELLRELGSAEVVNRVISLLKRYGIELFTTNWRRIVDELQYDIDGQNPSIQWIKRELDKQQKMMQLKSCLLSVDEGQILYTDQLISNISSKVISSKEENTLYLYWINNLLINNKYSGKVSSMKAELADDLTQAAIVCMGESWKDSSIRTYLNQLRKHVRGEEFTQPWSNGLLSSISAVITKGDDWEQLLRFLQSKEITDYRLAFSFYGILNGFANLTRDFTDFIYNKDGKYVSEVYREFYGQLHGVTIAVQSTEETIKSEPEQITSVQYKPISSAISNTDNTLRINNPLIKEILAYFKSSAFKGVKNKAKLENGLKICIEKVGENFTIQLFLSELSTLTEYGWNKNNKSWKLIQEEFCPDYKDNSSKKKKDKNIQEETSSPSLFDTMIEGAKNLAQAVGLIPSTDENKVKEERTMQIDSANESDNSDNKTLILFDNSWIDKCASLIDDKDARKQFQVDIEWFIGNHNEVYQDKKKGNLPGWYKDSDRSNVETINRLKKYLEKKLVPNEKTPWLVEKYKKIPIVRIIQYLEKEYGIR